MLTDEERRVLSNFVAHRGTLWTAIEKFAAKKKLDMDSSCADAMRSIPRGFELASDYASKAEAYKLLTNDLERFAEQS
jgi:hypothetical protein